MTKAILIINPSAGGEKAKDYEKQAQAKLATAFDQVELHYTQKAGDARDFARAAAQEKASAVFVMGGDGTVNEGISGLAEQEFRPHFGFFPLGTVNDLARALGLPLDPQEAIDTLDLTKTRPLDIGKVNDSYFMNVVAIGAIPESINDVDPEEKTKFGKLAYFLSALRQLKSPQGQAFELVIDGQTKDIETSTILIGLTNSIGGFEQLLPAAKVDDGYLHLIYLKNQNWLDSLKALPSLLTGVKASDASLGYHQIKQIAVALKDPEADLTINLDGDPGDELPVTISVLPAHLQVYTAGG